MSIGLLANEQAHNRVPPADMSADSRSLKNIHTGLVEKFVMPIFLVATTELTSTICFDSYSHRSFSFGGGDDFN